MPSKNSDWTRDELILALDLYFTLSPRTPDPKLPEVRSLSTLLGPRLRRTKNSGEDYRTPASVVMKLMNFRSLDPLYKGKGLSAGSRLDREVWNEFNANSDRISALAKAIRAIAQPGFGNEIVEEESDADEGGVLVRLHRTRERSRVLAQRKKDSALQQHGRLACEACGFVFADVYGDRGSGFIECHHCIPLAELPFSRKTILADLTLVCSNCHRMIHARKPWLTVEELRTVIKRPDTETKGES